MADQISKWFFECQKFRQKNSQLESLLTEFKSIAKNTLSKIEEKEKVKYTNQYALFSIDGDNKYKFQGIINTDDEEIDNEFDEQTVLIVPLPDYRTIPEFDGF